MTSYTKIQLIRSEILSKNIIKSSREIDKEISENVSASIHGLHFAWNARFLLTRHFTRVKPMPTFFKTQYDYYILFLSELAVIRALRYIGKKRELSADKIFVIKKLQIQRDESSKLGRELLGCFISYGQVDEMSLDYGLLLSEYFMLNIVKPLALVDHNFIAILPTPLSAISMEIDGNVIYLLPCTITLLIDYYKARETRKRILGYEVDCIETEGYIVACRYDERYHKKVKCFTEFPPFKIIIPKIEQVDDQLFRDYYFERKRIITHVAGIIVFGKQPVLPALGISQNHEGFILVFCEVPYSIDVSSFIHLGEPVTIAEKNGKYKLSGIKLKVERRLQETFKRKVIGTIYFLERKFGAEKQIMNFENIASGRDFDTHDWLEIENNHIYLYAPPFLHLSLLKKISPTQLFQVVRDFSKNQNIDIILRYRDKHKTWIKILRLENLLNIWYKVYSMHKLFLKKYKLSTLL